MSEKERILIVEDDENIQELIRYTLLKQGYRVSSVSSGEKLLLSTGREPPDLILLDIMLPGIDGFEICRILKSEEKTRSIPVILVTAKGEEEDVVKGLSLGADDYIPKPFSPRVLAARVRAVLRRRLRQQRRETEGGEVVRVRDLLIDPGKHKVMIGERSIDLTASEFQILHLLASRPGWVFDRDRIVEAVRGHDYHVTDRAVDVLIFGLRKKLGVCGTYIETVRGLGYRFKE